ncbi:MULTISPECIES: SDR family NAD(P)-dependent oxidoreductase [Saccharibacillus]|uniref:SDR family NAD(P)-dependent oxidoreductase n=1 Tax=Saccharibacillus TaxID=456492 RepID=UPI00123BE107|nr:SDR family NAD(P)-dependent oxidoreductase [Saccharibacillus sp. WB 17]MWJ33840.1 SDR family NAD(P)-dependent oxidoreductase [Saccharibacillus sp. WB 17]
MKTMVIIGAGKGLGLSLARRFGAEGFRVALVARGAQKLQEMVDELQTAGIEAAYFTADLYVPEQIKQAIDDITAAFGPIDVLEFSPTAGNYPPTSVLELTPDNAQDMFGAYVLSAVHVVNAVLPGMRSRRQGALLFTTGLSALHAIPMMGNVGIATSGLRSYVANLNAELAAEPLFVAHRSLGVLLKEAGSGSVNDPDTVAEMWYRAYSEQAVWEQEYPPGVTPATIVF